MLAYLLLLAGLGAVASVLFMTLRTGISPTPSSPIAIKTMVELLPSPCEGSIIEAGSGWGGLALAAARARPEAQIVAFERSLLPWLVSRIRLRFSAVKNLEFRREDFHQADFRHAAAVMSYLYPEGTEQLQNTLEQNDFSGWLISNTFALNGRQAERKAVLNNLYRTPVYAYRFKKS